MPLLKTMGERTRVKGTTRSDRISPKNLRQGITNFRTLHTINQKRTAGTKRMTLQRGTHHYSTMLSSNDLHQLVTFHNRPPPSSPPRNGPHRHGYAINSMPSTTSGKLQNSTQHHPSSVGKDQMRRHRFCDGAHSGWNGFQRRCTN